MSSELRTHLDVWPLKAASILINICVLLYLTQICACVNKFISVWTCVPNMNTHKNFRDIQRTRYIRYRFFWQTKKRFAPKFSDSVDVSVNVQCFRWAFCVATRTCWSHTHSVNFYVARAFTLRRKFVCWIFYIQRKTQIFTDVEAVLYGDSKTKKNYSSCPTSSLSCFIELLVSSSPIICTPSGILLRISRPTSYSFHFTIPS